MEPADPFHYIHRKLGGYLTPDEVDAALESDPSEDQHAKRSYGWRRKLGAWPSLAGAVLSLAIGLSDKVAAHEPDYPLTNPAAGTSSLTLYLPSIEQYDEHRVPRLYPIDGPPMPEGTKGAGASNESYPPELHNLQAIRDPENPDRVLFYYKGTDTDRDTHEADFIFLDISRREEARVTGSTADETVDLNKYDVDGSITGVSTLPDARLLRVVLRDLQGNTSAIDLDFDSDYVTTSGTPATMSGFAAYRVPGDPDQLVYVVDVADVDGDVTWAEGSVGKNGATQGSVLSEVAEEAWGQKEVTIRMVVGGVSGFPTADEACLTPYDAGGYTAGKLCSLIQEFAALPSGGSPYNEVVRGVRFIITSNGEYEMQWDDDLGCAAFRVIRRQYLDGGCSAVQEDSTAADADGNWLNTTYAFGRMDETDIFNPATTGENGLFLDVICVGPDGKDGPSESCQTESR